MTDQRVDIKVRVPLEVDTTGAAQAIANLPAQVRQAAEQATRSPMGEGGPRAARQEVDLQTRVSEKLRDTLGPQLSFLKNKKEINALYKEELSHVRTMEEGLSRLKRTEHGLSTDQLRVREKDAREARHFVNRLRDTIAVGTSQEHMTTGASRAGLLDMSAQQAMNGGLVGAGVGMLGRAMMAHPLLAGTALTMGAANWLLNKTDSISQYSEDIDVGFTNTGRRTGMGRNLRGLFQHARTGVTDPDFKALGYSGEDLAKISNAYGMPSSPEAVRSAILAQGTFARAYGFGENPEMMAGIGRRATQLGAAEPGQQSSFWRSMATAVEKGMRSGVDASETMRSVMALSEQAAGRLGVVSPEHQRGLAGIQAALSGSRFFAGERGASQVSTLMDAFQHPKSIGQERFMMNSIMGHFGGRVPSASEIGLTGARGAAYGNMTEIQQLQSIMQLLPELMANGKNKGVFAGMAKQAATGAGPGGEMVMLQALTGLEAGAVLNMTDGLSASITKRFGKNRAKELGGQPLSMLSALAGEEGVQGEIEAMRRGQSPDGTVTKVESLRQAQREISEKSSADIAEATREIRLLGTAAKAAAEELIAIAAGSFMKSDVNTNPLSGLFPSAAVIIDGIKRGMHGRAALSTGTK